MRPNKVSVENDKTVSRKMFRRGPFNIICFSTATLDLYTNTNLPVTWRQVRLATHSWRLCDKKMTDFAQEAEYKQLNKQIEGFEKELKQIDPSNPNSQTKKDAKDSHTEGRRETTPPRYRPGHSASCTVVVDGIDRKRDKIWVQGPGLPLENEVICHFAFTLQSLSIKPAA